MKRFLALYLPIAALLALVTLVVGFVIADSELDTEKASHSAQLLNGTEILMEALTEPLNHLRGILREPAVNRAFTASAKEAKALIGERLLAVMYHDPIYDHVRWADSHGMELVRVDRRGNDPVPVASSDLKNMSAHYSYKASIRLKPGELYQSSLDLNDENGVVEVPHKPTIRMVIRLPVVAGRDQGILMVNLNVQHIFNDLRRNLMPGGGVKDYMLLNPAGYWLMTPNAEDAWGFMFGRNATLARSNPAEWAQISSNKSGQIMLSSGLWSWITINPGMLKTGSVKAAEQWKLVTHTTAQEIALLQWQQWRFLLIVTVISLLLLGVGVYFYNKLLLEKIQSENELKLVKVNRAVEDKLSLALTAAGMGAFHWNVASGEFSWTDEFRNIFGISLELEPCYDNWLSLLHPEDRESADCQVRQAMESRSEYDAEYRILLPDGSVRWIAAKGRFYYGEDGSPQLMECVASDITEQKRNEIEIHRLNSELEQRIEERTEELQESEQKLRSISDYANDGIVLMDDLGSITHWNPAAERIFGYSSSEALGKNLHDLLAPMRYHDDFNAGYPVFLRTGEGAAMGKSRDLFALRKDGCEIPVSVSSSAVFLNDAWHAIGIVHDIHERMKYEKELEEARGAAETANKAKSEFLSNMSHEIRTPMNGVLGMTQLMEYTTLDEEQRKYVDAIKSSSHNLLRLINDILDLSKIEAGKIELEQREFSFRATISDLVNTQISLVQRKGLQLITHIPDAIPDNLIGDQLRLKQIILNFLSNAIKFTDSGAIAVTVAMQQQADTIATIRIGVTDSGIGISAEAIQKIFEPFSQADSSTTRKFGGTGLGLTISRQLAELLGGRIEVESTAGAGSTFSVVIPFGVSSVAVNHQENLNRETLNLKWDGRPLRVLVVDDNEINQNIAGYLLKKAGIDFVSASDGQEALEAWLEFTFDLILMDVHMPVMNGIEATKIIREKEAGTDRYTPIIALTADALREEQENILRQGFDGCVTKPFEINTLFTEMRRCIPEG